MQGFFSKKSKMKEEETRIQCLCSAHGIKKKYDAKISIIKNVGEMD
jgi:hypothetical protein